MLSLPSAGNAGRNHMRTEIGGAVKNRRIVNVLDKELTCFADGIVPPGQQRDIIEFGVTSVDLHTLTIRASISLPVWPERSTVSAYCTELTGWTLPLLKKHGMPFGEACRRLRVKHGSGSRLVITDASEELDEVKQQCMDLGVEYPFGSDTLNVSALFIMLVQPQRQLSLKEMLEYFGMEFEGTEHRAVDDSYNLARLYVRLMELCRGALPAQPAS
jgi:inhibitor of KinA sporulation pathway (predicted exonuclease)